VTLTGDKKVDVEMPIVIEAAPIIKADKCDLNTVVLNIEPTLLWEGGVQGW
jgi:hypothetical protein